jgi:methylated-DNA-[protein]-cysteine S-methyltransferase
MKNFYKNRLAKQIVLRTMDFSKEKTYNMVKKTTGRETMEYYMEYPSEVGSLLLTCSEVALTGLWMSRKPEDHLLPGKDHPILQGTVQWLDGYFAGKEVPVPVNLSPSGTAFQKRVWQRLLEIPFGQVITYGDIAREIESETGKKMSAQAVGGAVGSNPISIIIPCHRVVGAGGKLTGYAGGLEKKIWLLQHEGWEGVKKHDHQ